jgi:hypothetical protein
MLWTLVLMSWKFDAVTLPTLCSFHSEVEAWSRVAISSTIALSGSIVHVDNNSSLLPAFVANCSIVGGKGGAICVVEILSKDVSLSSLLSANITAEGLIFFSSDSNPANDMPFSFVWLCGVNNTFLAGLIVAP